MHPAEIQAAIKKVGSSQVVIAESCEVSPTAVGSVVKGRIRSAEIEQRISEITGISLAVLWPQHYGAKEPQPHGEQRSGVDPLQLAWIGAYIEDFARDRLQADGVANVRVIGEIYNQVKGRWPDEKAGKDHVAERLEAFLEGLSALEGVDSPEEQAKRLLRVSSIKRLGTTAASVMVSGSGNQVAGRDLVAGTLVKIGKKK